jgi:glycine cleavage system H lipoate-binding protein
MEGFRFVDIFATKGIEYIIVMAFLAAFIYFSRYLGFRTAEPATATEERPVSYFRVPDGYLFHQGHSWLRNEKNSMGVVGLDDFAQKLVGKVDSVDLPRVGYHVTQGEKGWSLVSGSKSIPMLAPVSGEVIAVNQEVLRSPAILSDDPYGKGWLFKVRSPRIASDTRQLLSGKVARALMEDALERLRPANPENLGPVLADGGFPIESPDLSIS